MGNAFVAGLKNEAPRGRDITKEDRNSEVSHSGTQRGAEGSEFSYTFTDATVEELKLKHHLALRIPGCYLQLMLPRRAHSLTVWCYPNLPFLQPSDCFNLALQVGWTVCDLST